MTDAERGVMNRSEIALYLRKLSEATDEDEVLSAGVTASIRTLTEGMFRDTLMVEDEALLRKHRARLRSALAAMAQAVDRTVNEWDDPLTPLIAKFHEADRAVRKELEEAEIRNLELAAAREKRKNARFEKHLQEDKMLLDAAMKLVGSDGWEQIQKKAREIYPEHHWEPLTPDEVQEDIVDRICARYKPRKVGVDTIATEFSVPRRIVKAILIERGLWVPDPGVKG